MPPQHAVPPALRPIVLLGRMRDLIPSAQLADLLAALTPPVNPTGPEWTDLCTALDAYERATQLGVDLDKARDQIDTAAAMTLYRRFSVPPVGGRRDSDIILAHRIQEIASAHGANRGDQ